MDNQKQNKKVLILGSGFGGAYTLRHLIGSLKGNDNIDVTMISETNYTLFTPLLHEAATGAIEPRHIAYPIRKMRRNDRFNFVQATVDKIDLKARNVNTKMGSFEFDYLVLALGSITYMPDLNHKKGFVFTLKNLIDSILIRNHIIKVFERASVEKDESVRQRLLTFVVAGGGYTGVQLVCELTNFVCRHLTRIYRSIDPDSIRVLLVEKDKKIMVDLHTKLGAYTMKQLIKAGVDVRLKSKVTAIYDKRVEINGEEIIAANTLIWVAGISASPRIAELDVNSDSIGRVFVNDYMEVPGFEGVYAVGDCAHFENPKTHEPIPPRAHTAVRQAKTVAHNILADIRGHNQKPYRYSQNAEIVSLGSSKAIFRYHGIRIYGFLARLLWLLAYSTLTPGIYNRIRIVGDWLWTKLFGRDITNMPIPK